MSGSMLRNPRTDEITIGKIASMMPMATLGAVSVPSHRMKRGASAIFGIALSVTSRV